MNKKVEELRNVRFSEAELGAETCMDAVSQEGEGNFEESQSTVIQFTHQIQDLTEVVHSLSEP